MEKVRTTINKGTYLVGYYHCGYWPRYAFFKVTGSTKSGAPRLSQLQETKVSEYSTPADSNTNITLDLENTKKIGIVRNARWSKKEECWVVRMEEGKGGIASLSDYIPGKIYSEPTYG